ncbi:hypothetical protein ASG99_16565 [Bacillus sp. Soil768D1]|nr:hypothetical protein ASG99_16565 [Bacillus sp. Soil768D1]
MHVQESLGELIQSVESIRALMLTAEREYEITAEGEAIPNWIPHETIRGFMPKMYPRAIELMQTIGAGGLLLRPVLTSKIQNYEKIWIATM